MSRKIVIGIITWTKPLIDVLPSAVLVTSGRVSWLLTTHWGRNRIAFRFDIREAKEAGEKNSNHSHFFVTLALNQFHWKIWWRMNWTRVYPGRAGSNRNVHTKRMNTSLVDWAFLWCCFTVSTLVSHFLFVLVLCHSHLQHKHHQSSSWEMGKWFHEVVSLMKALKVHEIIGCYLNNNWFSDQRRLSSIIVSIQKLQCTYFFQK